MQNNFLIDESWGLQLEEEFKKEYFISLSNKLVQEYQEYRVYPAKELIFSAFNFTPFDKVKVVILGQDPYHNPGQAHGLSFSVPSNVKKPASLINIFKELTNDLGIDPARNGSLEDWAKQGVFLLNSVLTVREKEPGSHQHIGWKIFTDKVIQTLSENRNHLVFILWGKFAQAKEKLIDESKHLILKAAHPSPFSAYNGFFSCKHFSKTNDYLESNGLKKIQW